MHVRLRPARPTRTSVARDMMYRRAVRNKRSNRQDGAAASGRIRRRSTGGSPRAMDYR